MPIIDEERVAVARRGGQDGALDDPRLRMGGYVMALEMKTAVPAREDPRVTRTRKLLQDAFLALLSEKGFHAISVHDIAARATVNRTTFYAHFLDKYDLLDQLTGELFRQALASRVSPNSTFTPARLKTLIVTIVETLAQINDHCKPADRELNILMEAKAQGEIKAFLWVWLSSLPGVKAGEDWRREVAATVMSSAIFGAAIEWNRGKRTASVEEVASHIVVLLIDGLPQVMGVELAAQI
jgi:AcrR family transcriptional regulator